MISIPLFMELGDENPIRTHGDYSKPSHEGYRNTIELPKGNNVVPLRSDTNRLVQNECSFHGLLSEDPNQHLKDFLKLVDSPDLDVANRERTCLHLFQFPFAIKLAIGLNVFLQDPSPHGMILLLDLLQKVPHHGIDRSLQIQIFYDHVSFYLKYEIDRAGGGKLCDKNDDESWEIIENLALYDHEGRNDSKDFVKHVKAISTSQSTSKTPDRRLLELEDQINFLLKESRPTPRSNSTHNPFTFRERIGPYPQPHAFGTTFEARIRDYMAAHTERMERFENAIFKQREEINDRMIEMFGLLKELTANMAPEKVLIRALGEEEKDANDDVTSGDSIERPDGSDAEVPSNEVKKGNEAKNRTTNKPIKSAKEELTQAKKEESVEAPSSQPVGKFFNKNEEEIFTLAGDGVMSYPDGVIFDEKKLRSS
ncbi:hypothetical protein Tco_1247512 [Tanacetum coccineum]